MAGARRPGRNFLFVPGPTNVPDRILRAMHVAMEDHRSSDFPKLTLPLYERPQADLQDQGQPGRHLSFERHRRLGIGAHQYLLARRQAARLALRPVQPSLDRTRPPPRAGGHRPGGGVGHRRQSRAHRGSAARGQDHEIKGVLVVHNETATGVTSDVAAVRRAIDAAGPPGAALCRRRELDRQHRFPLGRMGRRSRHHRLAEGPDAAGRPRHRLREPEGARRHEGRQVPPRLFRSRPTR